jgi:hypothetical protein
MVYSIGDFLDWKTLMTNEMNKTLMVTNEIILNR